MTWGFLKFIEDNDQEIFNGQEEFLMDKENFYTRRMMKITEGNRVLLRSIA